MTTGIDRSAQPAAPRPAGVQESAAAVYVGRQPIVDAKLHLVGYELLYRDGAAAGAANVVDGDAATYHVATRALLDIGWDKLVGPHFATVNATAGFLADGGYRILPPDRAIIEILEDVVVDDTVVAQVEKARRRGYRLALDDYTGRSSHDRLGALVSIVKIDVAAIAVEDLAAVAAHARSIAPQAQLLAEKVETARDVRRCAAAGCELFQGYFVGRPEIREGRKVPVSSVAAVRLLAELQDPDASAKELAGTIEHDPVLSYRLLVLVNSASSGLLRQVTSVRDALVMVGLQAARRLASVLAMTALAGSSGHLTEQVVVRAKMCESVAAATDLAPAGEAFTVGLFSGLDVILGAPMETVLSGIVLSDPVRAALLHRSGSLGRLLGAAMAFEAGTIDDLPGGQAAWTAAFAHAVAWAGDLRSELGT